MASSPLASRSSAILDCAVVIPDMFDAAPCISSMNSGELKWMSHALEEYENA